jgi:hypothetical protein
VVVIVEVPWVPCATVREEGEAETVNPGCEPGVWPTMKMLNKLNKQKYKTDVRTRLVIVLLGIEWQRTGGWAGGSAEFKLLTTTDCIVPLSADMGNSAVALH